MEEVIYNSLNRILSEDHRITFQMPDDSEAKELFLNEVAKKVITDLGESFCSTCHGTGEVASMERVYPGEPHMADIGEPRPCPELPHKIID